MQYWDVLKGSFRSAGLIGDKVNLSVSEVLGTQGFGLRGLVSQIEKARPIRPLWRYDGSCHLFSQDASPKALSQVDPDLCRAEFPTAPHLGTDGKCHEVVEQNPLIRVQELPLERCPSLDLTCRKKFQSNEYLHEGLGV